MTNDTSLKCEGCGVVGQRTDEWQVSACLSVPILCPTCSSYSEG